MPVGTATNAPTNNNSNVGSLFHPKPATPATPQAPVQLSQGFRAKLITAIQDSRQSNHGYGLANLAAPKAQELQDAVRAGDVVEVRLNQNVSVLLEKSADLEKSDAFFYKTTAGFAGTQIFGPISI